MEKDNLEGTVKRISGVNVNSDENIKNQTGNLVFLYKI